MSRSGLTSTTAESGPSAELSSGAREKMSARILIVEDDDDFREEITGFLKYRGYQAEGVAGENDALVEVWRFRPHLVLIDLHLPGRSGFQIAAEMTHLPGFRVVPIVAMSGIFVDEKLRLGMKLCGIRDFVSKPVDEEQLVGKIMQALQSAQNLKSGGG